MIRVLSLLAAVGLVSSSFADARVFNFKDPKSVNSISFLLDSELEPIRGFTSGISGEVRFDPEKPDSLSGKLVVATKTVQTPNTRMNEVLYGADWLNAEANPEITFDFKKVAEVENKSDGKFDLKVVGDFTCRGETRELTIPVGVTYLKDKAGDRMRGAKGDLLVLRSEFTINRKDFGIKPDQGPHVVAEEIVIRAQIVGGQPMEKE